MLKFRKSLVWLRRDLRSIEHAALYHVLKQSAAVYCVFIFDREILDGLPGNDRRVEFIHGCVAELDAGFRALGGRLIVSHATAPEEIPRLAADLESMPSSPIMITSRWRSSGMPGLKKCCSLPGGHGWGSRTRQFSRRTKCCRNRDSRVGLHLSANNRGWRWAASSGGDVQPYFRIFNRVTQSEKFDPEGKFIRRYLPQLAMVPDRFIHGP
jgi:deoxyribodipyrimidine photolyase